MVFSRLFNLKAVCKVVLDQSAVVDVLELALGIAELHYAILAASDFLRALFVFEEDRTFGKARLLVNAVLHSIVNTSACVKVRNLLEASILVGFNSSKSALECGFALCTRKNGVNELPCSTRT